MGVGSFNKERRAQFHSLAVRILEHAQKHGDADHFASLVTALPEQRPWDKWSPRFELSLWVGRVSPIHPTAKQRTPIAYIRRRDDPKYRSYDLARAASTPIFSTGVELARDISAENKWHTQRIDKCIREIRSWFSDSKNREIDISINATNIETLIRTISRRSLAELTEMYSESVDILTGHRSGRQNDATLLHQAILSEWKSQNNRAKTDRVFKWMTIRTPQGLEKIDVIQSPEEGMLCVFGYHVGSAKGRPEAVRQLILDDIFSSDLPPINGREYMQGWGYPNTSTRLKKLDRTLAMLGTNERGRGLILAPEQRRADLDYLKAKYYIPMKHRFSWTNFR